MPHPMPSRARLLASPDKPRTILRGKSMPKPSYQKLIERNARDDAVLQSIGDGLIVIVDVDKGGRIAYVNKVFEDMTGWKLEEIVNKPVIEVIPREDKDGKIVPFKERIVSRVLDGEKVVADLTAPFYYVRKDKSKFPVASMITPIIFDKKIIGAVETFRDISKESRVDKAKTEFVSLASHQLRTPLSTINWYIELLVSGDVGSLNEKQKQYLQEVYQASKRMVGLVNALLNVSRLEMGTFTVEPELVNIVKIAKVCVEELKPQILEKKLVIAEKYDPGIPSFQADPKLLAIIFQNLLSNSVKYTSAGGKIDLTIGKEKDVIVITVADTGTGIPKDQQDKIFTKLFRADNVKQIDPNGVGLGLYIVKEIIDHSTRGKIWFESEENKGTTFNVQLPIEGMIAKKGTKELNYG